MTGWRRTRLQPAARGLRIQFDSGALTNSVRIVTVFPAHFITQPVRSILRIRSLSIRAFSTTACLLSALTLTVSPSFSQQAPASNPPSTPTAQQPIQAPAPAPAPSQSAPAPTTKEPDYPDPRGITIGIFGLYSPVSSGPDIKGGAVAANDLAYENLYAIGTPYRIIPQFEFSVPVTRTGTLYVEFQRYHGWADQTLGAPTFIDSYSFLTGDSIHSTYHIITTRMYLDDLLFPHKFPVSRLRFKAIYGLRYISVTQTVDSATEDAVAGLPGSSFELGTNFILFPEFGAAMEYAIAPHVLFRVDGAGFGFPHHSDLNETSATLSVRKNNLEFLMGVKTLHFKTTPQKEEYEVGTFITPFVGLRWHW